jgi:hypothetical protein
VRIVPLLIHEILQSLGEILMKKLRLSMDALQVETFETLTVTWREAGTVQARAADGQADDARDACAEDQLCKCKDSTLA